MTISLLIVTVIFTFLPWAFKGNHFSKWRSSILSLFTCLAGGVIVGSLLFHLIPETLISSNHGIHTSASFLEENICSHSHSHVHSHTEDSHTHSHEEPFQWGSLAFGLSFFGLLAIDRLFLAHRHCSEPIPTNSIVNSLPKKNKEIIKPSKLHTSNHHHHTHEHSPHSSSCHHEQDNHSPSKIIEIPSQECHSVNALGGCHVDGLEPGSSKVQSLVFVIALSVHSFVEGLAVQSISTMPALFSFSISLFTHKCLEALALGISVYKAKFSPFHSFLLGCIYSLLTPLGIILSLALQETSYSGPILHVVFNGLAAGSFLFVAVVEMIIPELHTYSSSTPAKFLVLNCGFFGMAAMSLLPHIHAPHS